MKQIIDHIKELQKEYHAGTPAHTVLRKLEVELPGLFPEFDKFTLLKDTPTIATDNTLPPSSPTATAEEVTLKWAKYQIAKKYGYETWTAVSFYAIDAMAETTKPPYAEEALNDEVAEFYASLKEQEAHNRAISDIEVLIEVFWRFDREQQHLSSWHDKQDFLERLEKLKK